MRPSRTATNGAKAWIASRSPFVRGKPWTFLHSASHSSRSPIVDRSPDAARQLASRARRRIQAENTVPDADLHTQREVVEAFLAGRPPPKNDDRGCSPGEEGPPGNRPLRCERSSTGYHTGT